MSGLRIRNFGAGDPAALSRIKEWATEQFAASSQTLTVTEATCALPGCDPRETIITMWVGATRATYKINKAAMAVTRTDIAKLREADSGRAGGDHDHH